MSHSAYDQATLVSTGSSQHVNSGIEHDFSQSVSSSAAKSTHDSPIEVPGGFSSVSGDTESVVQSTSTFAMHDPQSSRAAEISDTIPPTPAKTMRRPVYKKKGGKEPKGILKPAPPPQKAFSFRRDILQNLNTRLAQQGVNVQVPVPQSGTAQATASYIGGMFRKIGGIAAGAAANVSGSSATSVGGYVANDQHSRSEMADADTTLAASRSSIATQSSDNTLVPVRSNSSSFSAIPLKKVQFQVSQMTVTYPIVGANAPEDEDLTRLRIEREHRRMMKTRRGKPWTPQELEVLYRECCKTREEHPLKKMRLVFQEASQSTPPALKTLDLSFVPLDRHAVEPIADLLSVEFGLNKVVLENCALTDDSVKSILHALLVSGTLPNLSLASNRKIRYHGWSYVAIFMRRARALRYLDLSENSINRAALEQILQAIAKPEKIHNEANTGSFKAAKPSSEDIAGPDEDDDDEFFDDSGEPLMPSAPLLREVADDDEPLTSAVISLRLENCGLKTSTLEMLSQAVRFSDIRHLSLRRNKINQLASVALAMMLKDYPDRIPVSGNYQSGNGQGQSYFDQTKASSGNTSSASADGQERLGRSLQPNSTSDARGRSYSPSLPEVPLIVSSPGGGITSRRMPSANSAWSHTVPSNDDSSEQIHEAMTQIIGSPTQELDARLTADERRDIRQHAAPNLSEEEAIAIYQAKRAKRILADLPRIGNLLTLDLKSNDIRGGVVYLAQVLKKNRTLRVLNLSDNSIENPGLVAVAEALKYNSTLETLDLSHNPCSGPGLEGITTLRTAFALNSNLKRLFLNDTDLSSEGAIALAEFLPEARSLIHLDVAENFDIDIAGVMALTVSLRMNHSLRCLDLNIPANNPDFARLSQEILQSCVRNTELAQKRATQKGLKQPIPALIYKSVVARAVRENDERLKAIETAQTAAAAAAADRNAQVVAEVVAAAAECHRKLEQVYQDQQEHRREGSKPRSADAVDDLIKQSERLRAKLGKVASTVEQEDLLIQVLSVNDMLGDVTTRVEQHRASIAAGLSQAIDNLRIDTDLADREEWDVEQSQVKQEPRSPSEDRAKGQLSEEGELFRKAKSLGLDDDASDSSNDEEALDTHDSDAKWDGTSNGQEASRTRRGSAGSATSSLNGVHGNLNGTLSGEELRKDLLEVSIPPKSKSSPLEDA